PTPQIRATGTRARASTSRASSPSRPTKSGDGDGTGHLATVDRSVARSPRGPDPPLHVIRAFGAEPRRILRGLRAGGVAPAAVARHDERDPPLEVEGDLGGGEVDDRDGGGGRIVEGAGGADGRDGLGRAAAERGRLPAAGAGAAD